MYIKTLRVIRIYTLRFPPLPPLIGAAQLLLCFKRSVFSFLGSLFFGFLGVDGATREIAWPKPEGAPLGEKFLRVTRAICGLATGIAFIEEAPGFLNVGVARRLLCARTQSAVAMVFR